MAKDGNASLLQRTNSSGTSMETQSTVSTQSHLHHSVTRSSSYDSSYYKESVTPQAATCSTSFDSAGYMDNIQHGMLVLFSSVNVILLVHILYISEH